MLIALLAGSLVYCVLVVFAARSYRAVKPPKPGAQPPISILKPLAGRDETLEANLRTCFEQDYPGYEILLAVHRADDPAVEVVRKIQSEYPAVPSRLLITGDPLCPNSKVFNLAGMMAEARYDLLLMIDSDIRVTPEIAGRIAAEFQDPRVGLITCPYRAAPGRSFWSTLEAIGLNTEFLGGILVARMLNGMDFAVGCAIAARREVLERIGGFDRLKDYLAEDFVMGKLAARSGYCVLLSSYIIEHHIGSHDFRTNLRHRLRWARSTRRSRPWGYVGQVFTNPLPLALLLCAARPEWWPLLGVTALFRAAAAWAAASWILKDPLTRKRWYLVPLQDAISFLIWIAGFFGNTILWRGRAYKLLPDGRFRLR